MSYIQAKDAPAPQYMLVVVHSEYEQSVQLFIGEQAARDAYAEALSNHNEAYISKLLA